MGKGFKRAAWEVLDVRHFVMEKGAHQSSYKNFNEITKKVDRQR